MGITGKQWDEPRYHWGNERRPVATGRDQPRQRIHPLDPRGIERYAVCRSSSSQKVIVPPGKPGRGILTLCVHIASANVTTQSDLDEIDALVGKVAYQIELRDILRKITNLTGPQSCVTPRQFRMP